MRLAHPPELEFFYKQPGHNCFACPGVVGQEKPCAGEATSVAEPIAGRDWLFADEAYHIDVSHLSATVRYSILVSDPATLALAVDLTEYGRRLASRLRPPDLQQSSLRGLRLIHQRG